MVDIPIIKETSSKLFNLLKEKNIPVKYLILFGSYSTGKNNKDSDIDYIIVSSIFRNKNIFEKAELSKDIDWALIEEFQLPFDIIYYSDIEWENKSGSSVIINEAKKYGKVLY